MQLAPVLLLLGSGWQTHLASAAEEKETATAAAAADPLLLFYNTTILYYYIERTTAMLCVCVREEEEEKRELLVVVVCVCYSSFSFLRPASLEYNAVSAAAAVDDDDDDEVRIEEHRTALRQNLCGRRKGKTERETYYRVLHNTSGVRA